MNKFVCVALGLCVAVAAVGRADEAEVVVDETEVAKALDEEKPGVSGFCKIMRDDVEALLRSKKDYARLFNFLHEHAVKVEELNSAYRQQDIEYIEDIQGNSVVNPRFRAVKMSEQEYEAADDELAEEGIAAMAKANLESAFKMFCIDLRKLKISLDAELKNYDQDGKLPSRNRYLRNSGCALGERVPLTLMSCQYLS